MESAKIGAIAPWFGGKRTMAPTIVRELGKHRAYWEPFCGSMAVLMAKPVVGMETVCDLHGDLINVGQVIQHAELGPQFYRRLRRTLVSEAVLEAAVDELDNSEMPNGEPSVNRAVAYFVQSWMMRSGVAHHQRPKLRKRGPTGMTLTKRQGEVLEFIRRKNGQKTAHTRSLVHAGAARMLRGDSHTYHRSTSWT